MCAFLPCLSQGQALIVRFYEGPASNQAKNEKASKNPEERLDAVLSGLVDVPTLMQTMPRAIRKAVQISAKQ